MTEREQHIAELPRPDVDGEPEDEAPAHRRPHEETSAMNRYHKYHSEVMSTWRNLQREYM